MKTSHIAAAVATSLCLLQADPAAASDLNYNYVELGLLLKADWDDVDGDGIRLRGSFEMANNLLLIGELSRLDFDGPFNVGVDYDAFSVGAAYVMRLNPMLDVITSISVGRVAADTRFSSESDYGVSLAGGMRGRLAPQVEGFGRLVFESYEDSELYVEGGALYQFNKQFSVGGELQLGNDRTTLSAIGRFSF